MIINIHEAKTNLSQLIRRALEGEEIIIANRSKPLVRLEVLDEAKPSLRFGGLKNMVVRMGDNFDDEMDDFSDYMPPSSSTSKKVADSSATSPAKNT
jgi:antitoxin (DNA-binding transcriptional repressor) of toxin-antitoxin stability system